MEIQITSDIKIRTILRKYILMNDADFDVETIKQTHFFFKCTNHMEVQIASDI